MYARTHVCVSRSFAWWIRSIVVDGMHLSWWEGTNAATSISVLHDLSNAAHSRISIPSQDIDQKGRKETILV